MSYSQGETAYSMNSETPSVHSGASQSEYSWVSNSISSLNSDSSNTDDSSSSDLELDHNANIHSRNDSNKGNTNILHPNENELFANSSIDTAYNPIGDPMIDVSKFISQSLLRSIESADFSKALQLQAKTSAHLNSKSLELQHLINESQQRLCILQDKLRKSQDLSHNIKKNLSKANKIIINFNNSLMIDYPIEFNTAKSQIIERQQDIY